MLAQIRRPIGPDGRRRGVTLVEMLVVVALVVLMMVILVQIFQAATGAMSASRTIQELDVNLRQVDGIIRSDLAGVTAKMTPPNDPKDKRGYFEYGENAFADAQGEDTDDYLAFTTRAPDGKVFTGRQWLGPAPAGLPTINQRVQPTTITSQVAEVIYFLRNGNLYRRVFLVVPERAKSITVGTSGAGGYSTPLFGTTTGGDPLKVSWLGMNDISARPNPSLLTPPISPLANDLGALTNRENRAFRPRFGNDITGSGTGPDGIPDDNNGDGVPDYYPTLYYDGSPRMKLDNGGSGWAPSFAVHEAIGYPTNSQRASQTAAAATQLYAFPFIYPGMYSVPDVYRKASGLGWIHETYAAKDASNVYYPNQAPLDLGDNLPSPSANQTWWGFPTWRETMAGTSSGGGVGWTDPVNFITRSSTTQPIGLQPNLASSLPTGNAANLLPPVYVPGTSQVPYGFDGAGSASFVATPSAADVKQPVSPNPLWEDDLLLTGVRSFDVKAYDPEPGLYNAQNPMTGDFTNGPFSAGYLDLGYGSTGTGGLNGYGGYILGPNNDGGATPNQLYTPWQYVGQEPQGFGHEGRMPPRTTDYRYHPRRLRAYGNMGNDNAAVQRLTRVWDSWSTDYTTAPDHDVFLNGFSAASYPIYPSFPPPYPSPLRGIQIQIRLTDPRGAKVKSITIRHDFTDKL